jgi:hypothetical protein
MEAKKEKEQGAAVFLSPRQHTNIKKRMTNLYDFEKNVLYKKVFKYYG